jgi:hypothetical protein
VQTHKNESERLGRELLSDVSAVAARTAAAQLEVDGYQQLDPDDLRTVHAELAPRVIAAIFTDQRAPNLEERGTYRAIARERLAAGLTLSDLLRGNQAVFVGQWAIALEAGLRIGTPPEVLVAIASRIMTWASTAMEVTVEAFAAVEHERLVRDERHRQQFLHDLLTGRVDLVAASAAAESFGLSVEGPWYALRADDR